MATKPKTTKAKTAPKKTTEQMQTVHVALPVFLVKRSRVVAAERNLRGLNALIRQLLEEAQKTNRGRRAA